MRGFMKRRLGILKNKKDHYFHKIFKMLLDKFTVPSESPIGTLTRKRDKRDFRQSPLRRDSDEAGKSFK